MLAVLRSARRAALQQTRTAAPDAATLTRVAASCRGDLAAQRNRALLPLLARLGCDALVAFQAEQLRFTELEQIPTEPTQVACPARV